MICASDVAFARSAASRARASAGSTLGDGLGLGDAIGVAGADDFGTGVRIGAGVCQVVRPGGGVGVADVADVGAAVGVTGGEGGTEGGGLGPSALAGEARSQASSPIAKVVVSPGLRNNAR